MKDTFIVRTEWADAILELKPLEQAIVFRNLFYYHGGQDCKIEIPNLAVRLVWKLIEPNLKRNIESYDKRRETSAENGRKGGRPVGSTKGGSNNLINLKEPTDKPNNLPNNLSKPNNPIVSVSVSDSVSEPVSVPDPVSDSESGTVDLGAANAASPYTAEQLSEIERLKQLLEEEKKKSSAKRKKEESPPRLILFSQSPIYDKAVFTESLSGTPYEIANVDYYHEVINNWSDAKNERKINWLATAKNWMAKDLKEGKLITKDFRPTNNGRQSNSTNSAGAPNDGFRERLRASMASNPGSQ